MTFELRVTSYELRQFRPLLAHHAVVVAVPHVLVGGVTAGDRRDAVGPGLGEGDAAVVVVERERVVAARLRPGPERRARRL